MSQSPTASTIPSTRQDQANQAVAQEQSTLVDGAEQRQADRRTSGCAAGHGPPREAAVAEADVHLQLIQIHHIIGKQNRSTSAQRRGESEQITKFTAPWKTHQQKRTHLDGGVAAAVEDLPRLHPRDRDRHLSKRPRSARSLSVVASACAFASPLD